MNLKKYFGVLSGQQKSIIAEQCDKITEMAKAESSKNNDYSYKLKNEKDGKCPRCGKTNIVDKIARVEGSGSVHGAFYLFGGSFSGSGNIDTSEINHCTNCGHEWKKYEYNYKWYDDILAEWINNINTVYEGKYDWGDKTIVLLKDFYAESIFEIMKKVQHKCYYSTKSNITLEYLRTKFKSIYD